VSILHITVERKHGHLLNITRALMIQSYLPKIYWSYFIIHVAHIINMLPTHVLNDFSPQEMFYKTPPDLNQLMVFGSLCYASTLSTNRSKFDSGASKCVFIGFKSGTKGYILLNIQSREILCLGMLSAMNMFFHSKGLRILAMKLTFQTFMIKFLL